MSKSEPARGESFHLGDRSGPSNWSHRHPERHTEAVAEAAHHDYVTSMPEVGIYRQLKSVQAEVATLLEVEAALADELENLLPLSGQRIDGELIEPVGGAERRVWDHNALVDAVICRIADELGPENSECRALVEVTIRRWLEVASPRWKLRGLRSLDVKADDYCTTLPGRRRVMVRQVEYGKLAADRQLHPKVHDRDES